MQINDSGQFIKNPLQCFPAYYLLHECKRKINYGTIKSMCSSPHHNNEISLLRFPKYELL